MNGGCLCGAVRYSFTAKTTPVTYCHCSMCRRWHGHVGAYFAVDREHVRVDDARHLAWFASSPGVRRGFCRECGSSLFFDEAADPKMGLCAGSLDEPTGLREKAHIHVASKGDYYAITGELVRYDTMPGK
jgi:hypothetical protein